MIYVYATLLVVLNLLWLFLVVVGLPGTWLMVLSAVGLNWWKDEYEMFDSGTLIAITALAVIGEVLEFISGMVGSKKAGGSGWGSFGALAGGVVGGIFGTVFIPILIVGSIVGVCLGAFLGAALLERLTGRSLNESVRSGQGAAVGRFVGIGVKLILGLIIWLVIAVAAYV
ncbi:MAG: DUF456 domain-containing protein [Planctomycetota bacterium]|nr:DUF456 domain-containing protein [Planctomycetota bacterium]